MAHFFLLRLPFEPLLRFLDCRKLSLDDVLADRQLVIAVEFDAQLRALFIRFFRNINLIVYVNIFYGQSAVNPLYRADTLIITSRQIHG